MNKQSVIISRALYYDYTCIMVWVHVPCTVHKPKCNGLYCYYGLGTCNHYSIHKANLGNGLYCNNNNGLGTCTFTVHKPKAQVMVMGYIVIMVEVHVTITVHKTKAQAIVKYCLHTDYPVHHRYEYGKYDVINMSL